MTLLAQKKLLLIKTVSSLQLPSSVMQGFDGVVTSGVVVVGGSVLWWTHISVSGQTPHAKIEPSLPVLKVEKNNVH